MEEWHRLRQSHEENLSKREREERKGVIKSGQDTKDKRLGSPMIEKRVLIKYHIAKEKD